MSLLCICREEKNKWMVSGHSASPPPWATALRTMAPHEIPRQYNYLPDFYRPENYPEIISLWTTAPPGQLPPMKFPPRQLPQGQLPMNSSSLDNPSPENPPIENCPLGCCLPDILPWIILPWTATLRTIASPPYGILSRRIGFHNLALKKFTLGLSTTEFCRQKIIPRTISCKTFAPREIAPNNLPSNSFRVVDPSIGLFSAFCILQNASHAKCFAKYNKVSMNATGC